MGWSVDVSNSSSGELRVILSNSVRSDLCTHGLPLGKEWSFLVSHSFCNLFLRATSVMGTLLHGLAELKVD